MSYRYKKKFPLEPTRKLLNNTNQLEYTKADILNIGNNKSNITKQGGVKKFEGTNASDIFNLKPNPIPKPRINPSHTSNIFTGARNDNQFSKEIKEYTKQRRIPEKEYDPTPYYSKLNANQQKIKNAYSDHQFL